MGTSLALLQRRVVRVWTIADLAEREGIAADVGYEGERKSTLAGV